jgi:hypothetical protein
LFNGEILHAGREVTSGVRHLYVASFTLGGGGGSLKGKSAVAGTKMTNVPLSGYEQSTIL